MDEKTLHSTLDAFEGLSVLVIGDVMLDAYFEGPTDRISPEAPVPVVNVNHRDKRPGGAANVALNVSSLGAKPVICSVIGDDAEGQEFRALMEDSGTSTQGLIASGTRRTTVKTRIISQGQQLMRVDEEDPHELIEEELQRLLQRIEGAFDEINPDAVIFEDYDKGVLTEGSIQKVIDMARKRNVPTIVDPKEMQFFAYEGVSLFKPNLKELREGLGIAMGQLTEAALKEASGMLRERLQHDRTLITLGAEGIYVEKEREAGRILATEVREVADVSGAGDTVVSVAALCTAIGSDPLFMARLANLAGGLVCEEVGVVPVDKAKLHQEALMLQETP
ncbi:MAG: bifunctional heptose 7-phosphate kinase/heptose 1-phosphate adenyltransferase [Flavobacteriales bacterium]